VQFDNHDKFLAYLNTKYIPSIKDPSLAGKFFYVSDTPLFYDSIHFAAAKNRFTSEMIKINIAIRNGLKSGVLTKILREMEE
jgi:hypothetical protein